MMVLILDLFIEVQMSVIMMSEVTLITEGVGSDRGSTQGLMLIEVRQQGGLF